MKNQDELLSVKELAIELRRSERYVSYMKECGLKMVGGRVTVREAILFLKEHPVPSSEARQKDKTKPG